MVYRTKTYIAGDWDHDKNAVNALYWWKNNQDRYFDFPDAHELVSARDDSLTCSIKRSLKERLDKSKNFVLIVGKHTNSLTRGSCSNCASYNSYTRACARGYCVSYESFIDYECRQAIEANMNIVVLYNSSSVDKSKCPPMLRNRGLHLPMHKFDYNASEYVWNYSDIKSAFNSF